jgi:hypothetical protein
MPRPTCRGIDAELIGVILNERATKRPSESGAGSILPVIREDRARIKHPGASRRAFGFQLASLGGTLTLPEWPL